MTTVSALEAEVARRGVDAIRLLRAARDEWAAGSEEWMALALLVCAVEALDEALDEASSR